MSKDKKQDNQKKSVNLRTVAARVNLAPCTVSAVLNDTHAAKAIPQGTKDRVFRAAAELNYRPNLWARSLRTKRTKMVAAVTSDFGRGPVAQVIAGVQSRLHKGGYLLALGSVDRCDENHPFSQFQQRGIEGVIAIDTLVPRELDLPIASVDLDYLTSAEPLTEDMRVWLTSMGESAADNIIAQIETQDTSRPLQGEPRQTPVYFATSGVHAPVEARESA